MELLLAEKYKKVLQKSFNIIIFNISHVILLGFSGNWWCIYTNTLSLSISLCWGLHYNSFAFYYYLYHLILADIPIFCDRKLNRMKTPFQDCLMHCMNPRGFNKIDPIY